MPAARTSIPNSEAVIPASATAPESFPSAAEVVPATPIAARQYEHELIAPGELAVAPAPSTDVASTAAADGPATTIAVMAEEAPASTDNSSEPIVGPTLEPAGQPAAVSAAQHEPGTATGPAGRVALRPTTQSLPEAAPGKTEEPARDFGSESRIVSSQPSKAEETSPSTAATEPDAARLWRSPEGLYQQLDDLICECETGCWALGVLRASERLGQTMERGSDGAKSRLDALESLARDGTALAAQLKDDDLASHVRHAVFALERRIKLWNLVLAAGGLHSSSEPGADPDRQQMAVCVAGVETLLRDSPEGKLWEQYLAVQTLRELTGGKAAQDAAQQRLLARSVLDRFTQVHMNQRQRQFLDQAPLTALRLELRRWATEPVEMASLLNDIERYEETAGPADGKKVAEQLQRLALSTDPARRDLAVTLESYYRNANVRVTATEAFLNRFIPERPPEHGQVNDVVLGRRVFGHSVTSADVKVKLIPDAQHLRLALSIDGSVSSLTQANAGMARFWNDGRARYTAWKELMIGPEGPQILPAEVGVNGDVRLRGVATDLDGVPLLGAIVQEVARNEHEARRGEAIADMRNKVYARAKQQIDSECDARMSDLSKQIEDRVLQPLADMALGPTVVTAETTEQRIVMRVRLAADDQLGGHTPRPMAPADSLASIQVHETALTNVVGRLQFEGGTFTLPQLRQRIAERFNRPEFAQPRPEIDGEDITITFAPRDAIRVRCHDGRMTVILAIAKLVRQGQPFEDFEVRVSYRPQIVGRTAQLVRDEAIQLGGARMNTRGQIALRGIFNTAFPKDRPLNILPDRITQDPRIAGLGITQLVVEDGWLGVALGPERAPPATAQKAARKRTI